MEKRILNIIKQFNIKGKLISLEFLSNGHINTTCLVKMNDNGKEKSYILQKINNNVFKEPEKVMDNISNITKFVKNKLIESGENPNRRVLHFHNSINGKPFACDANNNYWRVYDFVENSVTYNSTEDLSILEETGKAFGEFQLLLDEFPIKKLHTTIPHFHNTVNRYENFKNAVNADEFNRVKNVKNEIDAYLKLENLATKMYKMQKNNELQLRVTHNDTKCNNVLFDENTKKHLCVIDLDTVMPGLVGFDFGDAIRFIASTAKEDEKDIKNVKINLSKFKAFTKGFINKVGNNLTNKEVNTLALGAITMTTECGLRFLTDYLQGDKYFKTDYPLHNLVRARCQLALAVDMIKNYNHMKQIVIENAYIAHKSRTNNLNKNN